ncbi:apolipoprotein N-acyltransferase [Litorilituus lipolyticus]|uniref:apolipoprotein N-acyltransferase n=1 Tax=Litorilituus lipolyticus TaxID=2491017 RepID=UPI001FE5678E|nr:apolipoprotein N-acyltransferase [Litorilituus lipolyticus]
MNFIKKDKLNWLCLLAGLSLVFAYAPYSLWWLAFIAPLALIHAIKTAQTPKQAAKSGLYFAFGWFASGISWVHVSIDQFGGLPLFFSILLMVLLCLYLAIYPALASYLTKRLSKTSTVTLWLLPSLWLFTEFLRSIVLTGFPWLSLGYSQINSPLASYAPVIGEVGITFVILSFNVALYQLIYFLRLKQTQHHKNDLIQATGVIALITSLTIAVNYPTWVKETGEELTVALIQGNIEQSIKWQPEEEWPTMLKYLDLTRVNYDADLIIWPESAVPALEPAVQEFLSTVNQSALLNKSTIITGILNYNFESKQYFNALITLGKKHSDDDLGYFYNHSNRYYKNHLLPIGEFVPFQEWLRPIAPLFNLPQSSFSRGNYVQPNLIANDLAILPLICFEIAFPSQLAANLTQETNIILTVSNDAWFGDSHGPHQHLDMARMRALEFGKPLLRSTNNGITATIDHLGNISGIIPQFEEAVLKANIKLVSGNTPYSQWPRLILWLMILIPLVLIMLFQHYFTAPKKAA